MRSEKMFTILALGLIFCAANVSEAVPIGTAWTYQGRMMDTNDPADGIYDFQFKLFDAPNGGVQEGNTIDVNNLDVINGYFTVELDFGSGVFDGDALWLAIGVRPGDSNNLDPFVTLSPRQEVLSTPYSLYAQNAAADNDWTVSGGDMYSIPDRVGIGTTDPGMTSLFVQRPSSSSPFGITRDGLVIKNGQKCIGNQLEVQDSSGNTEFVITGPRVGIGTTNPQNKLDVEGAVAVGTSYAGTETAPTDGMIIQGNVGIGTTSPGAGLHLKGPGYPGSFMYLQSNSGQDTGIRLYEGDTEQWHIFNSSSDGGLMVCNNAYSPVLFADQSTGNVGIGTTAPFGKLHVKSKIRIEGSDTSFPFLDLVNWAGTGKWTLYGNNDNDFRIAEYVGILRGDRIVIKEGGNVGIGTTNPNTAKLAVMGGNVGIGTTTPGEKLTIRGNILLESASTGAPVLELGEGLDYAEGFDVTEDADIEAGTVLVIDSDNPGKLKVSRSAYDSKVAGIVAGAKGMGSGVRLGVGQFDYDVALAGRVYCKVDATEAAVQAGDQLTTSGTAGYAMKATDYDRARGAVLGKAMQSLAEGQKGQILVLVTLQ
jgi:hypothetical protein